MVQGEEMSDSKSSSCCCCCGPKVMTAQSTWSIRDTIGSVMSRVSNRYRMKHRVDPGLYTLGNPSPQSPVMVTANYKLTFDHLRRDLAGFDAWILVLDTKGINVWCAAGKGTFGTKELVRQIGATRLESKVDHRQLILPQLGAPGVSAHEVKKLTGFAVTYGPVRSADLPAFLKSDCTATPRMRTVTFGIAERAVLIPMEFVASVKKGVLPLIIIAAALGLQREGILFGPMVEKMVPVLVAACLSLLGGTVLHPLILPYLPARSFSLQGLLIGIAGAFVFRWMGMVSNTSFMGAACVIMILGLTSYLAFNFTGCTPIANKSGVKAELTRTFPAYILALVSVLGLFALISLRGLQ